jgi:POT family proton-dependent oligopeptide transporter
MRTMLTGAGIDPARAWSFGFAAAGVGMLLGLALYVGLRDRYLPGIGVRGGGEATVAPSGTRERMREGMREGTQPVRRDAALTHDEWQRIFGLLLMFVFVAFFWAVYEQAGSSLNLFADRYVDLHIAGRTLPSSWFQSAQPVFVIVLAPVFAELWRQLRKRRREPSTPLKMALGLAIIGVGCVFMIVAGRTVDACTHQGAASCAVTSPAWLTMFYLFSVLGELCVSPVGLSYVTKLAPARYVAFLMGAWFLTNATGSKLAGWLAALAPGLPQTEFFAILAAIGVVAATVLIFCVPWLKRLTQSAAG